MRSIKNAGLMATSVLALTPTHAFLPAVRESVLARELVGKLHMATGAASGSEKVASKKSDFQVVDPL